MPILRSKTEEELGLDMRLTHGNTCKPTVLSTNCNTYFNQYTEISIPPPVCIYIVCIFFSFKSCAAMCKYGMQ